MEYYIKVDQEGYVRDVLSYPHEGFVEAGNFDVLPEGILGGWYRWDGTKFIFDRAKFEEINEIQMLRDAASKSADEILDIIEGRTAS